MLSGVIDPATIRSAEIHSAVPDPPGRPTPFPPPCPAGSCTIRSPSTRRPSPIRPRASSGSWPTAGPVAVTVWHGPVQWMRRPSTAHSNGSRASGWHRPSIGIRWLCRVRSNSSIPNGSADPCRDCVPRRCRCVSPSIPPIRSLPNVCAKAPPRRSSVRRRYRRRDGAATGGAGSRAWGRASCCRSRGASPYGRAGWAASRWPSAPRSPKRSRPADSMA